MACPIPYGRDNYNKLFTITTLQPSTTMMISHLFVCNSEIHRIWFCKY